VQGLINIYKVVRTMAKERIAFIGGGNMARSLIGGLIGDGYDSGGLWVSDPDPQQLGLLANRFGVHTTHSNREAVQHTDTVILAVKPQQIRGVTEEIRALLDPRRSLVISIAAGIRTPALAEWLGEAVPIVRAMPNTPALVQSGATALFANTMVSKTQRDAAESILRSVGLTLWVEDETQMDSITALSGCGPAYFFLVMECLENAAQKLGLSARLTRLLTLQTAFGSAKLALESEEDSATLRARVTSPGGATEQAIRVLQQGNMQSLFDDALRAAHRRSVELADQLGRKDG
jgi:pyrroline-5-carboxylate reductase